MAESDPPDLGIVLGKVTMPPASPGKGELPGSKSGSRPFVDDARTLTAPFPFARVYRWIPQAAHGTQPPDAAIVVTQEVLAAVDDHVAASLDREIGGFLLGTRFRCPDSGLHYVVIDQYSEAQFTEASPVSLSFTRDAWARLADELGGKFNGKELVGWYHSHPHMDVFLSGHDVALHEDRFSDAWKSALVIEPAKGLGGFFCRRAGALDAKVPVEFFEYLPAGQGPRDSVMSWNHYTCIDSQTGATIDPPRLTRAASKQALELSRAGSDGLQLSPFPAPRLYRWNPVKSGEREADVALLVAQDVLTRVNEAVRARLDIETGGFLLGNRYRCPNSGREYVIVDQLSPALQAEGTEVSLGFTADVWSKIEEELAGKFRGKQLVGWYHSHPSMGVFLSPWDVELQQGRFGQRWMCALVIDPNANTSGFFASHGGQLNPREPVTFYEYRDRTDEESPTTCMPWSGYTAIDPLTGEAVNPSAPHAVPAPLAPTGAGRSRAIEPVAPPVPWYLDRTMQLRVASGAAALVLLLFLGPSIYRTLVPADEPTPEATGAPPVAPVTPPVTPPAPAPPSTVTNVSPGPVVAAAPTLVVTGTYAMSGRQPGQLFEVTVTGLPAKPTFTISGEPAVSTPVAGPADSYELQWRANRGTSAKTTLDKLKARGGSQRVEIAASAPGEKTPRVKVMEELTREKVIAVEPPRPATLPARTQNPQTPTPTPATKPAAGVQTAPPPTRLPGDEPVGNGLPFVQPGGQPGQDLPRPAPRNESRNEPAPPLGPGRAPEPPPPAPPPSPDRWSQIKDSAGELAGDIRILCAADRCDDNKVAATDVDGVRLRLRIVQTAMKNAGLRDGQFENKLREIETARNPRDRPKKLPEIAERLEAIAAAGSEAPFAAAFKSEEERGRRNQNQRRRQ
jgi:proteasome lid subunit RPN8/RPN11